MMKRTALFLLAGILASSMSLSAVAAPTPKGAPPGYEAQWKEIVAAEKAEEYERALALIDAIPAKSHNVYLRLKRSALLVRLGRFVEAEVILSALLKDPAADAIRLTVQGDLDDLRARMPRLTVRMAEGSAKDVWVTIDGEHVGPPVTIPINPGTHLVLATRDGKEVFKQKVSLQDSQTLEVEIDASLVPPTPPVSTVSVPPAPAKQLAVAPQADRQVAPSTSTKVPAFVAGGVGIVGIGVGTVFALKAHSAQTDGDRLASEGNADAHSRYDDGKRDVTFARVSFAVGLVGVGVSTYLLVTSKSEETPKQTAVRFDATAAPGFAGVTVGGAW